MQLETHVSGDNIMHFEPNVFLESTQWSIRSPERRRSQTYVDRSLESATWYQRVNINTEYSVLLCGLTHGSKHRSSQHDRRRSLCRNQQLKSSQIFDQWLNRVRKGPAGWGGGGFIIREKGYGRSECDISRCTWRARRDHMRSVWPYAGQPTFEKSKTLSDRLLRLGRLSTRPDVSLHTDHLVPSVVLLPSVA